MSHPMNPQLTKFIEQAKLDSKRHDEMLESVASLHGEEVAAAIWALHQQYRVSAADMMAVTPMLPSSYVDRYLQLHQEAYTAVASVLFAAVLGQDKWKDSGDGVIRILAQMNNDALNVMASARESLDRDGSSLH